MRRIKECFTCKTKEIVAKDKRTGRYVCKSHLYMISPDYREEVK